MIADVVRSAFTNLNLGGDRITVLDTGYIVTFRDREKETGDYLDCVIYSPRPIGRGLELPIVYVDRVSIPPLEGAAVDSDLTIVMSGVRDPIGGVAPDTLTFQVPIDELGSSGVRAEKDDDVRSDQLLAEVLRGVHRHPEKATYTLFRRCCFALMPALLAPIGFCIAEMARFRGRVVALVMSLVPLAMFYLGEVLGARLLISTKNPWCGWMPVALLTLVGAPLVWRQLRR